MIGYRPQQRAPGLAGVLALLALLAGIVAMHSTIFGTTHPVRAEHTGARSATTEIETRAAEYSPGAGHHAGAPTTGITGAGSGPHHETAGTTPSAGPAPNNETAQVGRHDVGTAPDPAPFRADQPFAATIGGDHATVVAAGPHRGAAAGPAGGPGTQPAMATSGDAVRLDAVTTDQLTDPDVTGAGCGGSGNDEHAAVHPCVFILVALTIALTLLLHFRLGIDRAARIRAARSWRGRPEQPPPWTVLSLAQLAILRI